MLAGVSRKIGSIKFAFLSPEEIRKMSGLKVITPDTYDDDGFPIEMGLMDPHLGVIEPGLRCKTCGGKVDECTGHFGHIDLAMPVIHVGFVKVCKMLLDVICRECGRVLKSDQELVEIGRAIEEELGAVSDDADDFGPTGSAAPIGAGVTGGVRGVRLLRPGSKEAKAPTVCPHCAAEQKKITLDKPTTFREDGHKLTPKEIRERLERIRKEDLKLLGLHAETMRPEWLILTALPVPPVTVRPSITLESGDRSEDDLTHKLVDVLRINHRLRENRDAGAPQLIVEDLWELLQYHITTYFDNQTSGIPPARHRSGRPLKTLVQRLKGKEGRFRSNLSGKRVNFSARTVISPDPYLSISEVGVPIPIARELSVPLRVLPNNLDVLRTMVMKGPEPKTPEGEYTPGVNYIVRDDGRRLRVTETNMAIIIKDMNVGWIVERQLQDGDVVLFNRQPSLHRMSMMAHRVRVMQHKTFRFNLCVCPPYNADFDGDEMNLHVPQSEEARAEARILMAVQEHILSPRFGGPVIGMIHDHITGLFMLTNGEKRFDRQTTAFLIHRLDLEEFPEPAGKEKDGSPYWSGKQLFSLLLPKEVSMEFKASILGRADPNSDEAREVDGYVRIVNGVLKSGTLDGNGVSAFKGKLLDRITRDYGPEYSKKFLDQSTKIGLAMIMLKGFSTGLDDEDIPEEAKKQIEKELKDGSDEVDEFVRKFETGKLEQLPGRSLEETLEVEVMKVLGRARDKAGQIASKHLGIENSAVIMARSGARGSMLNLSQMAGCIGQQAVRGERLSRGYRDRTLPHFNPGDKGAEAKGFVKSCYKSGLSPTEYFFHSMGGREGLVDTAVRTSRSGYMQRRLINALEDLKVTADRSVRNTAGTVIQFVYGEDGIDPTRSEQGESVNMNTVLHMALGEKYKEFGEELEKMVAYGELEHETPDVEPEGEPTEPEEE